MCYETCAADTHPPWRKTIAVITCEQQKTRILNLHIRDTSKDNVWGKKGRRKRRKEDFYYVLTVLQKSEGHTYKTEKGIDGPMNSNRVYLVTSFLKITVGWTSTTSLKFMSKSNKEARTRSRNREKINNLKVNGLE